MWYNIDFYSHLLVIHQIIPIGAPFKQSFIRAINVGCAYEQVWCRMHMFRSLSIQIKACIPLGIRPSCKYGEAIHPRIYIYNIYSQICSATKCTATAKRWAQCIHDDVIKWKHYLRYWPSVGGIHRPPVNSPYKGQWRGALMFSLIYTWINGWVNNRDAGDLRYYRTHYDVIVMHRLVVLTHWSLEFVFEIFDKQFSH